MNQIKTPPTKPKTTKVVPDFDQLPYSVDHIRCPQCGKGQLARIIHTLPDDLYEHECYACFFIIQKPDWKSTNPNPTYVHNR